MERSSILSTMQILKRMLKRAHIFDSEYFYYSMIHRIISIDIDNLTAVNQPIPTWLSDLQTIFVDYSDINTLSDVLIDSYDARVYLKELVSV